MKKKTIIIIAILYSFFNAEMNSQLIVFDAKTIKQLGINYTIMGTSENALNNSLRESAKQQEEIQKYILGIQGCLEIYRTAYKNVEQFGEDNKNIKKIGRLMRLILEEMKNAEKALQNNPKSILASKQELLSLTSQTIQCASTCYSLVSKSTVQLIKNNTNKGDDKLNWINPAERLDISYTLIYKLERILFTLKLIEYQGKNINNWSDVLRKTSPNIWFRAIRQKEISTEIADDIIHLFKN